MWPRWKRYAAQLRLANAAAAATGTRGRDQSSWRRPGIVRLDGPTGIPPAAAARPRAHTETFLEVSTSVSPTDNASPLPKVRVVGGPALKAALRLCCGCVKQERSATSCLLGGLCPPFKTSVLKDISRTGWCFLVPCCLPGRPSLARPNELLMRTSEEVLNVHRICDGIDVCPASMCFS